MLGVTLAMRLRFMLSSGPAVVRGPIPLGQSSIDLDRIAVRILEPDLVQRRARSMDSPHGRGPAAELLEYGRRFAMDPAGGRDGRGLELGRYRNVRMPSRRLPAQATV